MCILSPAVFPNTCSRYKNESRVVYTMSPLAFIILALCTQMHNVFADVNCTVSHRTGDIIFPFFKCPNNTHCVVSSLSGDGARAPGSRFSFVPVGCCPDSQPIHCKSSGTTYTNLLGCCPADSVCCVGTASTQRYLIGCAKNANQCCRASICEEGYSCCRTLQGDTCCPDTTVCRSRDQYLPAEPSTFGLRTKRISVFLNISSDQRCIPMDVSVDLDANRTVEYPYNVTRYPSTSNLTNYEGYFVNSIAATPNVTLCGTRMCYDDDTCVHRYMNRSYSRVHQNTTAECANASTLNVTAWDIGCFRRVWNTDEQSYAVGCCAAGKTPCGAHRHTFEPYEINAHTSPFLTEEISGCAAANETCCHPYICSAGSRCCTARRQVDGVDINITAFRERLANTTFVTHNEGHQFCCPDEAFCCEYIPSHAASRAMSMQPKSIPFCGLDATCTTNFFGNRHVFFPSRAVRETIPWDADPFTEELAFRQSIGIVGNPAPTPTPPPGFEGTCYYQVNIGGTDPPTPFTTNCQVINSGLGISGAGAFFAPNVAPRDQIILEEALGGKIPCPSPTPEIWCDSGV